MAPRWLPLVALLALLVATAPARPAEPAKPTAPVIVVKLRSLENLLEDAPLLAPVIGHEEEIRQYAGLFKAMIGPRGLLGLDPKRPIGFYGSLAENLDDSAPVLLLPVQNEKALLDSLEVYKHGAVLGKDGIYTVTSPYFPLSIYFRFANRYAYVTILEKSFLAEDRLLDPAKVLPEGDTGLAYARVLLDETPKHYRQVGLAWLDLRLAALQEKREEESDAEHAVRAQAARELSRRIAAFLHEGRELTIKIDLNRKTGEMTADVTLTPRPGSALAATLKEVGTSRNAFAGVLQPGAAANGLLHWFLPADGQKAVTARFHEIITDAIKALPEEAPRAQAERFFKALEASLNGGELDAAVSLRGPDKKDHYTAVAAARLKDGKAVDQALRELERALPADVRNAVRLDAEKANGVAIHRLDLQDFYDARTHRAIGDSPIYFAVRPDALLVAAGADGLAALKDALAATPKEGAPFQLDLSMARVLPLLVPPEDREKTTKLVRELFKDRDSDRLRASIEGGQMLRIRLVTNAAVLKLAPLLRGEEVMVEGKPER